MFYLIVPLAIALGALIGVSVIVWRKMPYLRKLTPESHEVGDTLLHDLAPEALHWITHIPWRQYLHAILVELEKLLRWMRMVASAFDRVSDTVIRRVRRVHQDAAKQHEASVAKEEKKEEERREKEEHEPDDLDMRDPEQLKQEEQRLIIAIAQHPRDPKLYGDLAKIYMRVQAYGDAVEALEQAVKLDPENEYLTKRLERAHRRKIESAKLAETLI